MTLTRHTYKKLTWVDVLSPSLDEVTELTATFGLHPSLGDALLETTRKPRIDVFDDHLYVVLHFPTLSESGSAIIQEIDCIIGKDFLITTRYGDVQGLSAFSAHVTAEELALPATRVHAGFLFYALTKELYRSVERSLEDIETSLEYIEARIFEGKERDVVLELSIIGRNLADFEKTLGYHRSVLDSFHALSTKFFGEAFAFHVSHILSEYAHVRHHLESNRAYFSELRETNNSLLSTKQNEIVKTLTTIAFVTFPLTLVASIFGMNAQSMPIIGRANDFWMILLLMGILSCLVFLYFKFKRWL